MLQIEAKMWSRRNNSRRNWSIDKTGVDKTVVEETGVDELGCYPNRLCRRNSTEVQKCSTIFTMQTPLSCGSVEGGLGRRLSTAPQ